MATLAQVRTRVDNWLTARWSTVRARQDAYFAANGRYWQGLKTHTVEPNHLTANFVDSPPTELAVKPTDQVAGWLDFLSEINNVSIPCAFVMDAYHSQQGHGYVAHVFARHNGTLYHRAQNVGPESARTVAWHVVQETL